MKKRTLIILGLASFTLTSLTQLPARLLLPLLPANLPVQKEDVSGTVWAGGVSKLRVQNLQLSNLQWDLHPLALLKGQLAANIRGQLLPAGQFNGDCGIRLSGTLKCTALNVNELPATILTPYLSRFAIPPLSGTFQADLNNLEWDQQTLPAGSGNLVWQDAGIQLAPQNFGNYTAIINMGENDTRRISLASAPDAAFELNGNISVQANGQYQSSLNLKPGGSINNATKRFLPNILGRPQPDGSFRIQDQGQIPLTAATTNRQPGSP